MTKTNYPASSLRHVLHMIAEGQKTGNLKLNFSQGAVSGVIYWNERETRDLTSTEIRETVPISTANCR